MATVCDSILSSDEEDPEEMKDVDKPARSSTSNDEDESGSDDVDESDEDEKDELHGILGPLQIPKPVSIRSSTSSLTFRQLGIAPWIVDQLTQLNLKNPTLVQQHCVPKVLEGADVLGCAKTGTGKTLAFALPIIHKLSIDPFGVYALILTPTRELAFQISEQFQAVGAPINLKTQVIVGGRDQVEQSIELARRPHIVVATPGRLADHISSHSDTVHKVFSKLAFLVLDEADRLLDGQYALQIKEIFKILPTKRQTLLFSATITSALNQLHQVSVRKPYFFEDDSDVATVEKLEQKFVLCPLPVKDAYLVYVVRSLSDRRPDSSFIIFAHTCRECEALAHMFAALGFSVGSLHSQIPQSQRMASLAQFRAKRLRVLICTDVASRGLDIPHVDVVVNHSLPQCPKTYVHRVGRSARAGRFGSAISFVTQYDILLLQAVEKLIGKKIDELKVSGKNVALNVTEVLVKKREAEMKLDKEGFGERRETNVRKGLLLQGMKEEHVDRVMEERKRRRYGGTRREGERPVGGGKKRNKGTDGEDN